VAQAPIWRVAVFSEGQSGIAVNPPSCFAQIENHGLQQPATKAFN
jgi:hypothetical protein